ncbi:MULTISPECIES: FTR1 family iron permease [unclassified Coleofasciculus]|uniref:FTR1 family iron permease n=1 Tax=unclassified Coleofasciculus TaxID=2692782 RepID=UPI0018825C30|nr:MULTISPECIES: FTR1 family protein [unclassified Coleofasciculus]MBE9125388.1 FTR1 family iron permease [Coleofasciculus sp. LEGE 07081]MBE9147395.1 FTR1 family iron permease [Coleofasciculus sp. LEGE 07092]
MDFSPAIPTFVITLREGVEAALVVGIVLACLQKAKAEQLNPWVYSGVVAGIVVSVLVGILFTWGIQALSATYPEYAPVIEPLLEAVFGVIAIALLSWMLIWMTQQAKSLKAEIEGNLQLAIAQGTKAGWGVFGLIFIAVLREGFETVVFIVAKFQQGLVPALGAVAGIIGAVVVGFLLFKWGVKINIRQFFQVMGVLLLLIVAGLVVGVLAHFDQAAAALAQINPQSQPLCFYYDHLAEEHSCFLGARVWDTSGILPDNKFPGLVLKALFGYRAKIYLLQAVSYLLFLFAIGSIYFRSLSVPTREPVNSDRAVQ